MRKHPFIAVSASTAVSVLSVVAAFGAGSTPTTPTSSRTPIHTDGATTAGSHQPAVDAVFIGSLRPFEYRSNQHHRARMSRQYFDGARGIVEWRVTERVKPVHHIHHVAKPVPVIVYTQPVAAPVVVPPPAPTPAPTPAGTGTPGAPYQPAPGDWYRLRMCESSDNYATNTGNGYYGAYQFALPTWYSLGFTGFPSDASPAVQDKAAEMLQARSGWGQWPACSAMLGL